MLKPRRFDEAGRRAYLDDVRPRFLLLRVKADKVNISWGVPLWALEELAAFALGAATIAQALLPLLPATWRARVKAGITVNGRHVHLGTLGPVLARSSAAHPPTKSTAHLGAVDPSGATFTYGVAGSTEPVTEPVPEPSGAEKRLALSRVLSLMDDLAGGSLRDLLRVPPGEPYFEVSTQGTRIQLVAH